MTPQFPCPSCGYSTKATKIESAGPASLTRLRRCQGCGHSFQTKEVLAGAGGELSDLDKLLLVFRLKGGKAK
jgi:hypothetical protein